LTAGNVFWDCRTKRVVQLKIFGSMMSRIDHERNTSTEHEDATKRQDQTLDHDRSIGNEERKKEGKKKRGASWRGKGDFMGGHLEGFPSTKRIR
jgi:hypothetical protein